MRTLFEIDTKDYKPGGSVFSRPSVRGIIIRGDRLAMIHSLKYDYYKLPGGGAEPGESQHDTLIREVREESGLAVIPDSIREFGMVHRIQRGRYEDIFIQDNFYYLCDAQPEPGKQALDGYENEEIFTLEFVVPEQAVQTNLTHSHGEKASGNFSVMLDREVRVIRKLIAEGYFAR